MSHFTVMVIGAEPEKQLAPFDESIEMDKYNTGPISNDEKTRFLDVYTTYESNVSYGPKNTQEAEENKKKTFDELYKIYGEDWNSCDWEKDERGIWCRFSTYNPNSKWDWYSLGGRWSGMIKLKEGASGIEGRSGVFDNETGIDQAKKGDIANFDELTTFAVLKDGKWYEKGEMGWWAIVSNQKEEDQWANELKKLVEALPDDTLISIYDCHI